LLGRQAFELASAWMAALSFTAGTASIAPLPLYLALVAAALWVAVRMVGRPADPLPALRVSSHTLTQICAGLLVAGLLVAVTYGFAVRAGWAGVERASPGGRAASGLVGYAILYAGIALNEELAFRGALLGILSRWGTPALGVVATSALFAAVHVLGVATWERLAGIFLLGVLLALLRIRSGSLWPAIACHWGFHVFSYAAVLGVLPARLVLGGPVLLVGRADQLDAGLVSIVALAAATVCAALVTRAGRRSGHR